MSEEVATKKGINPMARIVAVAQAGVEPDIMGTGPIPAVELVVNFFTIGIIMLQNLIVIIEL